MPTRAVAQYVAQRRAHHVLGGCDDLCLALGAHAAHVEAIVHQQPVVLVRGLRRVHTHAPKVQLRMPPGRHLSVLAFHPLHLHA